MSSTVCTHRYADCLLKSSSTKHSKYIVNQKLENCGQPHMVSSKDCHLFKTERDIKCKIKEKYNVPWGSRIRVCNEWFAYADIIPQCRYPCLQFSWSTNFVHLDWRHGQAKRKSNYTIKENIKFLTNSQHVKKNCPVCVRGTTNRPIAPSCLS